VALKEKISEDLKAALLSGDHFRSDVIRGIKAVVLNEEVALNKREEGLDDEAIEKLIAREVKKRNESAAIYDGAGRSELATNERKEAEILSLYLPEQLSKADIEKIVDKAIGDLGVSDARAMGQIIGFVKKELGNSADGALIASIVKEKLS
jgi:uncharacterized protein YqeY